MYRFKIHNYKFKDSDFILLFTDPGVVHVEENTSYLFFGLPLLGSYSETTSIPKNNSQPSRLLYKLKRNYGIQLYLYQVTSDVPNWSTGTISFAKTRICLNHAILIPQNIRYYTQNRTNFQLNDREIIIDQCDLPETFEIGEHDYFVTKNKRYNIVETIFLENVGHVFHVRQTGKQLPHQEIDARLEDNLVLSEAVT